MNWEEELENRLCTMREALQEVAEDDDPRDGCAHADRAKQALASAPVCRHKEEAKKLRQEMAEGYGCKLCHCCGENSHGD